MAKASATATAAQNISSKPINGKGSPNWLKGVKNSQKRKERKKMRAAIRHLQSILQPGKAQFPR